MKTIYTPIAVSSGELPEIDNEPEFPNWSKDVFFYNTDGTGYWGFYDYKSNTWISNGKDRDDIDFWLKKEEVPELTEEGIRKLAVVYYGDNPHLYGGQRDGFFIGYKAAQYITDSKVEVKWEENMK